MRCLRQFSCLFLSAVVSQLPLAAEQLDNIQAQIQASAEEVQSVIDKILSTPPDQQTFENTLGAWDAITEEIQATSAVLEEQMKADFQGKAFARESIREYQLFIDTVYMHHAELYDPLFSYAKKALTEDSLRTPVQRRIAHLLGVSCEQFKESMSWENQEILETLIKLKAKTGAPYAKRLCRLPHCGIHSSEEDHVIPCGDVSATINGDSNGNASAGVSVSEQSSDGRLSVEGHANVSLDSQGNVTTSGGVNISYDFRN